MPLLQNRFFVALSTFLGAMVGAGIFGIPYVLSQSGAWLFLAALFIMGGAVSLIHLLVGEIALRTQDSHRLIGYGSIYLGRWGKALFTFTTLFSIVGALLAYVVIGGIFLHTLTAPFFALSATTGSLLVWAALSLFIVRGIRLISKAEAIMSVGLFAAVFLVLAAALREAAPSHIPLEPASFLSPFGVLLFAFGGWAVVPEIADLFRGSKDRRQLDNVIGWTMGVIALLYATFAFVVVGVTGAATSQDAFSALLPILGERVVVLGTLFGVASVATSYLVVGNYLKNSLRHDFGMSYLVAAAIAIFSPIVLFLLGAREFVPIIALVGGVALSLEGLGILVLYGKVKRMGKRAPEYAVRVPRVVLWVVAALLVLATAAELLL